MRQIQILVSIFLIVNLGYLLLNSQYSQDSNIEKEIDQEYQTWRLKFKKLSSGVNEEYYRKQVFRQNYLKIKQHNQDSTKTFTLGLNQFSDLSLDEFSKLMLTLPSQLTQDSFKSANLKTINVNLGQETQLDWREKGVVTPIRNQGRCGSCYAFSAIATLESAFIIGGFDKKIDLSEQQCVDCSYGLGNYGCDGGHPHLCLTYSYYYGFKTEQEYPYKEQEQVCQVHGGKYKISNFWSIKSPNRASFQYYLSENPINVGLDASSFQSYKSGILNNCRQGTPNHAVTLVGFTQNYWIIKNSWGSSWGEEGYIRILMEANSCNMNSYPASWPDKI